MPRLAIIAIHALAVTVLGTVAYKVFLEPDEKGGVRDVRGGKVAQGKGGKSRQQTSSRPDSNGGTGGAIGGAEAGGAGTIVATAPPPPQPVTTTRTIRKVLQNPAANQYGDDLQVIETKLTSTTYPSTAAESTSTAAAPSSTATGGGPSASTTGDSRVISSLPFTGMDLAGLITLAVAFFSAGFALRRLASTH